MVVITYFAFVVFLHISIKYVLSCYSIVNVPYSFLFIRFADDEDPNIEWILIIKNNKRMNSF